MARYKSRYFFYVVAAALALLVLFAIVGKLSGATNSLSSKILLQVKTDLGYAYVIVAAPRGGGEFKGMELSVHSPPRILSLPRFYENGIVVVRLPAYQESEFHFGIPAFGGRSKLTLAIKAVRSSIICASWGSGPCLLPLRVKP